MVEIRNREGAVISRSRNLRGLRRAVGKQLVSWVSINEIAKEEGKLCVMFANGDSCETNFASFYVLKRVIRNWRNLYGVKLLAQGEDVGTICYSNPALQ